MANDATTQFTLRERFETFVQTLDQFESIDDLLRGSDADRNKRADYLLGNRQFIIEQKTLVSNPTERPQKFVDKLATERGFVFYGTLSTADIFRQQPDAEDLQRRMILDLSRTIDDIVAKADKQTSATRDILNIPDAAGILVILNERAVELRPDVIHYALWNTFQKKTTDGKFRYAANDTVILISEANILVSSGPVQTHAFPIVIFTSPARGPNAATKTYSESLIGKWAAFNNAPLLTMPVDRNLDRI